MSEIYIENTMYTSAIFDELTDDIMNDYSDRSIDYVIIEKEKPPN